MKVILNEISMNPVKLSWFLQDFLSRSFFFHCISRRWGSDKVCKCIFDWYFPGRKWPWRWFPQLRSWCIAHILGSFAGGESQPKMGYSEDRRCICFRLQLVWVHHIGETWLILVVGLHQNNWKNELITRTTLKDQTYWCYRCQHILALSFGHHNITITLRIMTSNIISTTILSSIF